MLKVISEPRHREILRMLGTVELTGGGEGARSQRDST